MRFIVLILALAGASPAFADCAADITAAKAAAGSMADKSKAAELTTLIARADMELTAEHDERECRDIMKDARKLMN
ncbi:MAG: hypothetical protein PHS60_14920 [Zavarzinia sp.]|nr:hypothetical protein [Zavarzinia sp.]